MYCARAYHRIGSPTAPHVTELYLISWDLPNLLGYPLGNLPFPQRVCELFSRGPPRRLPPWAPSLVHLVLAPPPIVGAVVPAELLAHSEVA